MKKGAALCTPLPRLSSRSAPREMSRHSTASTVPTVSPIRRRPGVRPSMTALGSKTGIRAIAGMLLVLARGNGRDGTARNSSAR